MEREGLDEHPHIWDELDVGWSGLVGGRSKNVPPFPPTAGYGNLSPQTMAARLFCIFFALVGIPLNLVVLNRLGHLMQRVVHRCARRMGGAWQVRGSGGNRGRPAAQPEGAGRVLG